MNKTKSIVITLCLLLFFGFVAVRGYQWFSPFNVRSFDKAAWAQANPEERASIAHDAIRLLPRGMPENEIELLLGKPMAVVPINRLSGIAPKSTVRTYTYFIGNWPLAAFDSTQLWVHVDAEGKVVGAVIGGY